MDLADGLRLIAGARRGEHFGHEDHLRFAWGLLSEAPSVEDAERVANLTIRHVAELAGNPNRYNCTMTIFWIRMLHQARREGVATLEEAIAAHPELADSRLPHTHWSDIDTEEARTRWVDPDLRPMP